MRFTIIYKNDKAIREKVIALLLSAISQGNDLSQVTVGHPLFSSRTVWPDIQTLLSLPLNIQCEEMEFVDGSIKTIRLQVIDIESVVVAEISVDKPAS